jgi:lipopolysaccharide export system permease protein
MSLSTKKREVLPTLISMVVLYKKYSVPVSAFILTIIAVSVSYKKRRGGMGMNLTIGIAIALATCF